MWLPWQSRNCKTSKWGGEIRIRGRYWSNGYDGNRETRIPDFFVPFRPIGPFGVTSLYDWSSQEHNRKIVEQRTALHVAADFTDDVCAYIDLHDWAVWGEDFRSDYITGADSRANTADDVEVYQAYIQADNFMSIDNLRLRIGRQELVMGKGWLVGNMISPTLGLSFDAIRLTYDTDMLTLDAWWSKLVERTLLEEDGDVDFYGVYATVKACEAANLSAYWYWVRDARSVNDTNFIAPLEWIEDAWGLDDYDVTDLHTLGIRLFGASGGLDYDLELAYQFGEADAVGAGFAPFLYGDDGAEFDAWAGDLEIGYTLTSLDWAPRFSIGAAYYQGEDHRDLSFMEWLNPFTQPQASLSFNRLFSKVWYTGSYDILSGAAAMTNFMQVRTGLTLHPTEKVTVGMKVAAFWVDEPFDLPAYVTLGSARVPIAPALSFWSSEGSDDLGYLAAISVKYDYSDDWFIKVGWEHIFSGDAMEDGSFIFKNGLEYCGGIDKDDADYIYFDTGIKF